jgi:acyl carrier protein
MLYHGPKSGQWGQSMFPARVVEKAVRGEITSAINDRPIARERWEPEVDSLVMVRVVLRIEEEFAINLPDDVMPSGGFLSVEHCVATVMETCRKLWNVNQPVTEEV